jgi:bromodomain-containing factor 1
MLLDAIELKQSASIFLEPVDPIKLNIPEYLIVIKKPMDLRTMRTKVNKRRYKSIEDFKQDIDQIVWNCMTFNARN